MKDLAVLFNSVDALHAHYVEWVRFLEAKGDELRAQLAKLEAKKAKANMPISACPSSPDLLETQGEEDFLDIVFRSQANSTPDAIASVQTPAEPEPGETAIPQDELVEEISGTTPASEDDLS
jgi:hypothetical protein